MTLDPRVSIYLNVISGILLALIGGTAYWQVIFDAHTTAIILAGLSLLLLAVNAVLHMIPSKSDASFPLGPPKA